FREEVFPVCSPAYLAERKLAPGQEQNVPLAAEDIATLRLLHLRSNPPQRWFDWSDWFTGVGIQPPVRHQELTFNNYQMVLQAVLLGQGVGLGWAPLVNDLIDQGALVRLSEKPLFSSRGYHLVTPPGEQEKGYAHIIATWLKAELQLKSQ
ncbi:MAG TPA: LysR substrate-binding domain-containing protein, partial [Candidatus Angelobacter sp.]|nr:LysR substrate-binding domain-containing protein [Candidatus Angelobacter sp.]